MSDRDTTVYETGPLLRQFGAAFADSPTVLPGSFAHYVDLLLEENQRINLVSRETTRAGLDRLAAESLLPFVHNRPPVHNYLDIGSGGGFPAVPIMLALHPRHPVLLERTQKKAHALGRIIAGLGLSADIRPVTLEEYRADRQFDLVTLRYVALTPALYHFIDRLLAPDGLFIHYSRLSSQIAKLSTRSMSVFPYHEKAEAVTKYFTLFGTHTT